jgi:hydroxymethylpyrimidine pyrophosphatase-like HAD family hydrolase
MLLAADIGYAVENASDEVKAAADRITVHAKDAALARIIEDIDQMLTEKTIESES